MAFKLLLLRYENHHADISQLGQVAVTAS